MKTLARNISLILLTSFLGCTMPEKGNEKMVGGAAKINKDSFHQLCQYWEVTDADNPTFRDLFDNQHDGVVNYPGIVFMTDSTFLENPRAEMRYGTYHYQGKVLDAQFDDGTKVNYTIQLKGPETMTVSRTEKDQSSVLYLKSSDVFYPDNENPYSKPNTRWMIKPGQNETEQQLKDRLKGCVTFYQYFINGHVKSSSAEIDFTGLPSCFRWYQGGIFVQSSKSLDKKWINCFYSEDQALQARGLMQEVLQKKYDWDTTTQKNWLAQIVPVLEQIKKKL